jgi:hypothetical protein
VAAGLPKPIIYTNLMMTSFDAAELMPDAHKETMNEQFRNKRFYVSLSMLHVSLCEATKDNANYRSLLE